MIVGGTMSNLIWFVPVDYVFKGIASLQIWLMGQNAMTIVNAIVEHAHKANTQRIHGLLVPVKWYAAKGMKRFQLQVHTKIRKSARV
jgi:hypothetical protein